MNTDLCFYFPTNPFALPFYYLSKISEHFSISLVRNKVPVLLGIMSKNNGAIH